MRNSSPAQELLVLLKQMMRAQHRLPLQFSHTMADAQHCPDPSAHFESCCKSAVVQVSAVSQPGCVLQLQ